MIVSIASDHAGFIQKKQLVSYLKEQGYDVEDLGPQNEDRVDYPDYGAAVARHVASGKSKFGILVCGTGIGMAITANKIKGIRAANVTDPEFARLCRAHNDANLITLSGRYVGLNMNKRIVDVFLSTQFEGGRHALRLAKIKMLE